MHVVNDFILQEVVLHKAENPWMPMVKGDMGVGSAKEAQAAELYHKFQGILNKLTPQKFQALAEQALKLEINTEERLSRCIDKVYSNVRFYKNEAVVATSYQNF